jgi:hypothetical protein
VNYNKFFENFIDNLKRSNIKVFSVFLLISSLIWVVIKFSKDYTVDAVYQVEFTSVPSDLVWDELPETELQMRTTGNGFSHIKNKLFGKKIKVSLTYLKKKNENDYFLLPKEQIGRISNQFPSNSNLFINQPDTILFDFSKKVSKRVPVKFNGNISLAKSFMLKDDIKLTPDSVLVSGPESIINSIESIDSEEFEFADVNNSIEQNIALNKPESKRIELSDNNVVLSVEVEKYTQNTLSVPIIVQNVPEKYILKTFPDRVDVIFNTGLSDFKNIKESSFRAVIDFNLTNDKDLTSLPVNVEVLNEKAQLIRVSPSSVEFILRSTKQENN